MRTIAFWVTTFIIVFELVAGSVWNLKPIEWNVVQLRHLGYPAYLAYILGAWHVGAAVAIAAPGCGCSRNGRTRVPFSCGRVP